MEEDKRIPREELYAAFCSKVRDLCVRESYRPVRVGVRGLCNQHNTCFLNAMLQAMLGCNSFAALLFALGQGKDGVSTLPPVAKVPTTAAFVDFARNFQCSSTNGDAKKSEQAAKKVEPAPMVPTEKLSRSARRRRNRKLREAAEAAAAGGSKTGITAAAAAARIEPSKQMQRRRQNQPQQPLEPLAPRFDALLARFSKNAAGQQEDAHEFLSFALAELHTELSVAFKAAAGQTASRSVDEGGWQEVGSKGKRREVVSEQDFETSPISQLMGGRLRLQVAKRGMKDSVSFQPFYSLHLHIEPDSVETIGAALDLFMTSETLEGYKSAPGSNRGIRASQQALVDKAPKVLTLHLKRFCFSPYTGELVKLTKRVHFEPSLTFNPMHAPDHKRESYALQAVIRHHGDTAEKGHYTAYVRRGMQWLHFNDRSVKEVTLNEVLQQQAYMLFYEKD